MSLHHVPTTCIADPRFTCGWGLQLSICGVILTSQRPATDILGSYLLHERRLLKSSHVIQAALLSIYIRPYPVC